MLKPRPIILLTLLTLLTILLCITALAAGASGRTEVELTFNGFPLELDNPAWAEGGVTAAPVEEVCAAIGTTGQTLGNSYDADAVQAGLSYWWAEDGAQIFYASWNGGEAVEVAAGKDGAELVDGVLYAPLRPFAQALGFEVSWTNGRAGLSIPPKQVEVSSLEELLNAVDHNTVLLLDLEEEAEWDFSALDWSQVDNPHVIQNPGVDTRAMGYGDSPHPEAYDVILYGVHDLTISASSNVVFSTPWAYADVLKFQDCRRLTLEGVTAVHNVEPGSCMGDCLELNSCQNVRVVRCTLDGSGAYGLNATDCSHLYLEECEISHCTYGAVTLTKCRNVNLQTCSLANNQENFSLVCGVHCREVRVEDTRVQGCGAGALASFSQSSGVVFNRCAFDQSGFSSLSGLNWGPSGGAVFVDCTGLEACLPEAPSA